MVRKINSFSLKMCIFKNIFSSVSYLGFHFGGGGGGSNYFLKSDGISMAQHHAFARGWGSGHAPPKKIKKHGAI